MIFGEVMGQNDVNKTDVNYQKIVFFYRAQNWTADFSKIWTIQGVPVGFVRGVNHSSQIGEKIQFHIMKGTSLEDAYHQTERYWHI